jgi:hypothetical protein
MAQTLTILALVAGATYLIWRYRHQLFDRFFDKRAVRVVIRLDREAPGAHLIWNVSNAGPEPVTITKLIVHGPQGTNTITLASPQILNATDTVLIPSDVDWTVLAARSIAVADAAGHEYAASRSELAVIQEHLRQHIDRRVSNTSARDFLFGAADLAFGVVILGLGFFMLMWVIATG